MLARALTGLAGCTEPLTSMECAAEPGMVLKSPATCAQEATKEHKIKRQNMQCSWLPAGGGVEVARHLGGHEAKHSITLDTPMWACTATADSQALLTHCCQQFPAAKQPHQHDDACGGQHMHAL